MSVDLEPVLGGDRGGPPERKMSPAEVREFKLWCHLQRTRPSKKRERLAAAWREAAEAIGRPLKTTGQGAPSQSKEN